MRAGRWGPAMAGLVKGRPIMDGERRKRREGGGRERKEERKRGDEWGCQFYDVAGGKGRRLGDQNIESLSRSDLPRI